MTEDHPDFDGFDQFFDREEIEEAKRFWDADYRITWRIVRDKPLTKYEREQLRNELNDEFDEEFWIRGPAFASTEIALTTVVGTIVVNNPELLIRILKYIAIRADSEIDSMKHDNKYIYCLELNENQIASLNLDLSINIGGNKYLIKPADRNAEEELLETTGKMITDPAVFNPEKIEEISDTEDTEE